MASSRPTPAQRQEAQARAEEQARQLRESYSRTFRGQHGKRVLEDLIERYDPVIGEVPPNGDAAIWMAAVRRVMNHLREQLGGDYAAAMARVDERSRGGG